MLSSRSLDKENASSLLSSSKARIPDGTKSINIGGMIKKKVFGDVKNTILNQESGAQTQKTTKNKEMKNTSEFALLKSTVHAKDEEMWPEPESLPVNLSFEDDYEDCFPPDYPRFGMRMECSLFLRQSAMPNSVCPDSPMQFKARPMKDSAHDFEMELLPGILDVPPVLDDFC